MKEALKYIALAAGGYLLYSNWSKIQGMLPSGTTGDNTLPSGSTPVPSIGLAQRMSDWASNNNMPDLNTADEWDFVYQAIRGITPPAPDTFTEFQGANRMKKVSLDEFLGITKLSGIVRKVYVR